MYPKAIQVQCDTCHKLETVSVQESDACPDWSSHMQGDPRINRSSMMQATSWNLYLRSGHTGPDWASQISGKACRAPPADHIISKRQCTVQIGYTGCGRMGNHSPSQCQMCAIWHQEGGAYMVAAQNRFEGLPEQRLF